MLKYLDPDRRGYLHGVQPGDVIRPHEQPPHVRVPAEKRGDAWAAAAPADRPRGYAFWNIPNEGQTVNGTNETLSFAPTLNAFLHVRGG